MAAPTRITVNPTPKKSEPVTLGNVVYQIKPPKSSLLLIIAEHAEDTDKPGEISRDVNNIMKLMFSPKKGQYDAIKARLADPEDDLDIDHIFEVVEALVETKTGNPTS